MAGRSGGNAGCKAGEGGVSFCAPDTMASGTHTHPSSEHLGSLALCFRTSASSAAAPTNMLVLERMETDKGDVTVTSKATCLPLSQSNASVSAGQVRL